MAEMTCLAVHTVIAVPEYQEKAVSIVAVGEENAVEQMPHEVEAP